MWFVYYPVILGSIPKNRITKLKDKHIFKTSDSYCQIPHHKTSDKAHPPLAGKAERVVCEPVCKERNAGGLPWRPSGPDTALPLRGGTHSSPGQDEHAAWCSHREESTGSREQPE